MSLSYRAKRGLIWLEFFLIKVIPLRNILNYNMFWAFERGNSFGRISCVGVFLKIQGPQDLRSRKKAVRERTCVKSSSKRFEIFNFRFAVRSQRFDSGLRDEKKPFYRLFKKSDLPQLSRHLKTLRPEIAGIRSDKLYDAICFDAISNRSIVIIVADENSKLIGFNITIIGRRRFFRYFLLKHPLLSVRIARQRLVNVLRGLNVKKPIDPILFHKALPYIAETGSSRSWKDSSPDIAKVLFTAVLEGYRGRRVSVGIGDYLLQILEDRSVRRLDTLLDPQNLPSIRLTHRLGFRIERRNEWLLGSVGIGKRLSCTHRMSELSSPTKD